MSIALFRRLETEALKEHQYGLKLSCLYQRYQISERLGEAHALFNELQIGLSIAENYSLPFSAGLMLEALGRLSYTNGSYLAAVRYWTACIDISKQANNLLSLIEARIGLGQIYDAMQDWETGARFHRDAGELLGQIDELYLKSKWAINLALIIRISGKPRVLKIYSNKQNYMQNSVVSGSILLKQNGI